MTPIEITGIIATLITSLVAAYLGYRQHQLTQSVEKNKETNTQEREFIDDLIARVDKLEERADKLGDKVSETARAADEERRKLADEYQVRTDVLRKEMRRAIDEATMELATWRDKYFTLIDSYQTLKLEYATIQIRFNALEKEYAELRRLYALTTRAHPDIESTP